MFKYVFNIFGPDVWYNGFILKNGETIGIGTLMLLLLAVMVASYLLGAVNSALIVSKLFYKEDIRSKGSGNAGTTNMMRSYGKVPAIMTLVGDMLKTMLGMMVGTSLLGLNGAYIAGLFCVVGHIAPLYYRFKGGKGVASTAMVVLYLDWLVFLICILLFVMIVWATKYISLASVICELVFPLILTQHDKVITDRGLRLIVSLILALTVVFMHRDNIRRIMNKEESKFQFKKTKKPTARAVHAEADSGIGSGEDFEEGIVQETDGGFEGDRDENIEASLKETGKAAESQEPNSCNVGRAAGTVHKSGKKKKARKK